MKIHELLTESSDDKFNKILSSIVDTSSVDQSDDTNSVEKYSMLANKFRELARDIEHNQTSIDTSSNEFSSLLKEYMKYRDLAYFFSMLAGESTYNSMIAQRIQKQYNIDPLQY